MNLLQKKIQECTRDVTLSVLDMAEIRAGLVEYMHYKPIRTQSSLHNTKESYKPFTSFFRAQHLSGALIIALIVASSSVGVSYAAVDALPGDFLYPVKVDVNEEVKSVMLTNSEDRLEWQRERAELRLEEASKLVAEGRLDAELTGEVSKRFAEHADAVVAAVQEIEASDPYLAAEVTDEFESALDTHGAVLARLAVDQTSDVQGARSLVEQVHTVAIEAGKIRNRAEEQISIESIESPATVDATSSSLDNAPEEATGTEMIASASDEMIHSGRMNDRVFYRAKTRAEEQRTRVEALLEQSEEDAPFVIDSRAQVEEGKQLLTHAQTLVDRGDMSGAYRTYREAVGSFQKVAQLLEVNRMFSIEIPSDIDNLVQDYVEQDPAGSLVDTVDQQATTSQSDKEVEGVAPSVSIIEQYSDGMRTYFGTITGLGCATVTPTIVHTASSTNEMALALLSVTEVCAGNADVSFEVSTTTSEDALLRAVELNGIPQPFTVFAVPEEEMGTGTRNRLDQQALDITNSILKRVFEATQEVLTPHP